MNRRTKSFLTLTGIIAAIIIAATVFFLGLFSTPLVHGSVFNDSVVTIRPSLSKSISLALTFWSVLGLVVGALVAGAAIAESLYPVLPDLKVRPIIIHLAGVLVCLLLIAFSYLVPGQNVQTFTGITMTKEEAATIKDADKLFTEKNQYDPRRGDIIKTDNELK
jgi:cellulose synthase/poly-beta-1,6-N-acetylglucosamine synthase-like glycosyltransferase